MTDSIITQTTQTAAANNGGSPPGSDPTRGESSGTIAAVPVLKGLILYAAIFTFAGLSVYFIIRILGATSAKPPSFDGTLLGAAAALAGVLGSAFALEIGTPTDPSATNPELKRALDHADTPGAHITARLRLFLSLEPSGTDTASWPKSIGIWAYAVVASAVAITYVTHQSETPSAVKALAVAFAGYVLALVRSAYGNSKNQSSA